MVGNRLAPVAAYPPPPPQPATPMNTHAQQARTHARGVSADARRPYVLCSVDLRG
jgi:hypothetical protein